MEQTKYEKKLLKDIEVFDTAYKDWNNKKLPEEEREKAQKIVDKMTDDYTDSGIAEKRLESYGKGKEDCVREVLKLIKAWDGYGDDRFPEGEVKELVREIKKLKKEVRNSSQA